MEASPLSGKPGLSQKAAETITRVEELAYELKVKEVMSVQVKTLAPETTMDDAREVLREARISGAPVQKNGELIGVISIEDVIRCLRKGEMGAMVTEYMTPRERVVTIHSYDPVIEALKKFVHTQLGRLPVIDEDGMLAGIITKGDINRGLLKALQNDIQEEEIRRYRASHLFEDIISNRTSLILRYNIKPRDYINGGTASSYIKRALLRLGATPQLARRVGIAIYEAEMNLVIHTDHGGVIRVEIEPHQISVDAYDDGPGIKDIAQALRPGYTTATEEVREKGFGAGMGLVNIARCVDDMKLDSTPGRGTRLKMKIYLPQQEAFGESTPPLKKDG